MKFALIVIGMIALAVMLAGCTSQEHTVDKVVSTPEPVYNDTPVPVTYKDTTVTTIITPTSVYVDLKVNPHPTDTVIEGCKVIVHIDSEGRVQMRNGPENPPGCDIDKVGKA